VETQSVSSHDDGPVKTGGGERGGGGTPPGGATHTSKTGGVPAMTEGGGENMEKDETARETFQRKYCHLNSAQVLMQENVLLAVLDMQEGVSLRGIPMEIPPVPCDPGGAIPSHVLRVRGVPTHLRDPLTDGSKMPIRTGLYSKRDSTSASASPPSAPSAATCAATAVFGHGIAAGNGVGRGGVGAGGDEVSGNGESEQVPQEHYLEALLRKYVLMHCCPSLQQVYILCIDICSLRTHRVDALSPVTAAGVCVCLDTLCRDIHSFISHSVSWCIVAHHCSMCVCVTWHTLREDNTSRQFCVLTYGLWKHCLKTNSLAHCNTLQHTAVHCNPLQHITTQCNAYAVV